MSSHQQERSGRSAVLVAIIALARDVEAQPTADERLERLLLAPRLPRVTALAFLGLAAVLGCQVGQVPMRVLGAVFDDAIATTEEGEGA